ncbi:BTB/POZ domain containing protein [Tritrichomonas foetus]|uniref:BTB/POZ domain containing protein n=1 Tax=Tritrichomonas foetus TaxID=1144522 RepID=A0A1J4KYC7_9EUKA|nr:BTB/POZ domain containing protein [Tritrichomonas foetus]|eukprot:OHT16239.1 BTB/POZ domain containing protein [Tritrichomonas foetus]
MDYSAELFLCPNFNYKEFKDDNFLADCEVRIHHSIDDPEYVSYPAHVIVLANSSEFFYNVFTGDTQESATGIVDVYTNPMGLLPSVIDFMYTGQLDFTEDQVMALYHIAHDCGIRSLEENLNNYLESQVIPANILAFVNQCYDYELVEELKVLEDYVSKFFRQLSTNNLTQALDVITYTHILEKQHLSNNDKIKYLNDFIGKWECDDEELAACAALFDPRDKGLKSQLSKLKVSWLPKSFLK